MMEENQSKQLNLINLELDDFDLLKFINSPGFRFASDIIRILLLIAMFALIVIMLTNIEAVKLLLYNPCKICEANTGARCLINAYGYP